MSDRSDILRAVRNSRLTPRPLPAVPSFSQYAPPATPVAFGASLALMGGIWDTTFIEARPDEATLNSYIRALFPLAREFCSAVAGISGTRAISPGDAPGSLQDVDVGIVRARFGVAETGSVWLSEEEMNINALGYLAQHLIVLLDSDAIEPNLHLAYRRREFHTARYAVLMTGPSATADIEGVLIRGAQGVRSLRVIGLPPAQG